jgi:hypothetical protein
MLFALAIRTVVPGSMARLPALPTVTLAPMTHGMPARQVS